MSVIIKGMKFPKGCDSYDLVQDYDEDSVCCPFLRSESWYGTAPDYRLEHCPLIGIPTPHGRLIDAGALANKYERFHRILKGSNLMADKVRRDEIDMFLSELKCNAPTIIEAEVE